MRTINVGDCYILHDIIHGKFSVQQSKTLHYAFGTLSSRPVLVLRPPAKWDKFGMVTVIPAMSNGNPSYEVPLEDIFGNQTDTANCRSTVKWVPHYPYSVPVNRLGKYIGSLSISELKEVLEAFEWIHDPFKQMNEPVPSIYRNIDVDESLSYQKVQSVQLDTNLKIKSLDEFNSLSPKVDISTMNPTFRKVAEKQVPQILEKPAEGSTETPEETEKKVNTEKKSDELSAKIDQRNPMEFDILDKRFSTTDKIDSFIKNTVGNIDILYEYYINGTFKFNESVIFELINKPKRTRFSLHNLPVEEELKTFTEKQIEDMWATFDSLNVVDLWLIIPALNARVLSRIYKRSMKICKVLRDVCIATRKLTNSDYSERKQNYILRMDAPVSAEEKIEKVTVSSGLPYVTEADPETINKYIVELKPFLTYNQIEYLPSSLYQKFLSVPMYRIQRAYQGKKFLEKYKETLAQIASAG